MQLAHHPHHFDEDVRDVTGDRLVLGRNSIRGAQHLLQMLFTGLLFACGIDKFTHLLGTWDRYLPAELVRRSPVPVNHLLYGIGIVEVAIGVVVACAPRAGAILTAAWLSAGALSLGSNGFYELALRDGVLALVAIAFARLSSGCRIL